MARSVAFERFRRSRSAVTGLALLAAILLGALVGPALDQHSATEKDVLHGTSELGAPLPPSAEYPFGTDAMGRCVAARLWAGARASLTIGILAGALALLLGTAIGLIAGTGGRVADQALMRAVDVIIAVPFTLLVIALAAVWRDGGKVGVVLILGAVGWTAVARVVRAKARGLRNAEFVTAAASAGGSQARIVVRHILPNVLDSAVVLGVSTMPQLILAEATLAYVGLGSSPAAATWGRMLSEGQPFMRGAPWLVTAPGLALVATVVAIGLVGEGLRDALG